MLQYSKCYFPRVFSEIIKSNIRIEYLVSTPVHSVKDVMSFTLLDIVSVMRKQNYQHASTLQLSSEYLAKSLNMYVSSNFFPVLGSELSKKNKWATMNIFIRKYILYRSESHAGCFVTWSRKVIIVMNACCIANEKDTCKI